MSGKIKGITLTVGGDTSGLRKELNAVNKETASIQKELREVEKALKLDPKNTELLAQKQKLLADEIDATENKLKEMKKAQENADKAIADGTEISEKQYRMLQREISNTEAHLKELNKKAEEGKIKFDALGKSAEGMNTFMKNAGVAVAATGAGIVGLGLKAAAAADDINTLATQTGLSTDQIQIFQYASDRIDVSLDTLTGSLAKLTRNMYSAQQGSKNQSDAFKALGVSITDNDGKLRNNQAVMNDAINALSKMENETQRDAYAMQLFGKSAQDLNPLILGGADALNKMAEEARKSGVILDEETLQSANRLNDAVDTLKATATGAFSKIGAEIAEGLTPYVEPLAEMIAEFGNFVVENQDAIVTAIGAIGTALLAFNIVTTIQGVIQKFTEFKEKTESLTVAQAALNLIMNANPIALIVAAVAGLVAAFVILWNKCDAFREFWISLWEIIKESASTVWETIKNLFISAWEGIKGIWNAAQPYFQMIWDSIKLIFSTVKEVLFAYFNDAWTAIKLVWDTVTAYFQMVWDNIKLIFSVVKDVLSGDFSSAWEGIKGIFSNVGDFFSGVWTNIKSAFNASELLQVGRDMLTGIWSGISDKVEWLKGQVRGVVDKIKSWFTDKDGFDTHSPSKWSKKVMGDVFDGFDIGAEEKMKQLENTMSTVFDKIQPKNISANNISTTNSTVFSPSIVNYITSTPQTAFEVAEQVRRNLDSMINQAVLS